MHRQVSQKSEDLNYKLPAATYGYETLHLQLWHVRFLAIQETKLVYYMGYVILNGMEY
jgi:hypothetical protein